MTFEEFLGKEATTRGVDVSAESISALQRAYAAGAQHTSKLFCTSIVGAAGEWIVINPKGNFFTGASLTIAGAPAQRDEYGEDERRLLVLWESPPLTEDIVDIISRDELVAFLSSLPDGTRIVSDVGASMCSGWGDVKAAQYFSKTKVAELIFN